MDLFVYSPVASATHDMHLDAIASYGADAGMTTTSHSGRPQPQDLWGSRDRRILVESTGLWNLVAMPFFRARSSEVVYYLHEPSTLKTKVSRGNGFLKSLAWQTVQRLDVLLATTVIVSRDELKRRAIEVYGVKADKVQLAPLLSPPPIGTPAAVRPRITYLGRIDDRRYLHEFIALAPRFDAEGLQPTILTSDRAAVDALDIPSAIDVFAEKNFSEDVKADVLNSTAIVWNPKNYAIAQSGVTVDALRYGCQIVLTNGDPECEGLEAEGIAIRFDGNDIVDLISVERSHNAIASAHNLFAQRHGGKAFNDHYLPLLDVETAA